MLFYYINLCCVPFFYALLTPIGHQSLSRFYRIVELRVVQKVTQALDNSTNNWYFCQGFAACIRGFHSGKASDDVA